MPRLNPEFTLARSARRSLILSVGRHFICFGRLPVPAYNGVGRSFPLTACAPVRGPAVNVLVVDIGGSHVKVLATGRSKPRRFDSGKDLTARDMVDRVLDVTRGWDYQVVSLGYPGTVGPDGPEEEPGNLAHGWVGFEFDKAFGKPVRIINDAAMQALGGYTGGRMLFLGLGTGLGSTLVARTGR